jgi:hypothetical protein
MVAVFFFSPLLLSVISAPSVYFPVLLLLFSSWQWRCCCGGDWRIVWLVVGSSSSLCFFSFSSSAFSAFVFFCFSSFFLSSVLPCFPSLGLSSPLLFYSFLSGFKDNLPIFLLSVFFPQFVICSIKSSIAILILKINSIASLSNSIFGPEVGRLFHFSSWSLIYTI